MIANMRYVALTIVLVVALGTLFEASVALGWRSIGALPGEGPGGEDLVLRTALLAMLAGAPVAWALSLAERTATFASLLAPAAAAFMVARFYSFDPYYAPTLRRMSDGGILSPVWVFAIAALALLSGLFAFVRPREGFALTVPVLLLCAFTAFIAAAGH
jgi:hypothetical protein